MIGSLLPSSITSILEVSMAILDIFSKRQKRLRGENGDVYQYKDIPKQLRGQIVHILCDIFNIHDENNMMLNGYSINKIYKIIHNKLAKEYGVFDLYPNSKIFIDKIHNFILISESFEQILDLIEISFGVISEVFAQRINYELGIRYDDFQSSINELNQRFREHKVGFQYECGNIIRIDSQFIHDEVVKSSLILLNNPIYKNANNEFHKAHEHYRHERYEESITEANKAFESVLKIIHAKRRWNLPSPANSKKLIASAITNKLLTPSLSNYFNNITEVMGGLSVIRNNNAGHGAGVEERTVPAYMASYVLHLTATNVVFLIEAEKALK